MGPISEAKYHQSAAAHVWPYANAAQRAPHNAISIEGDIVSLSGDSQAMAKLIANNAALEALSEVPRTMQDWRRIKNNHSNFS